jgi:two-component system cell cycle response regulator CtrA
MRLLMVEKSTSLPVSQTRKNSFFVFHASSADDALSMLRHEIYDIILVDIDSMAQEGFSFIRRLRLGRNDTPLLAVTGCHAGDRIRALGLGADDALAQPIDPDELHARISAVIRRNKGYSQSLLRAGDLSVCIETHEVRFRDTVVRLTGKEYAVLELLILRKGTVITKDMLLNHLYGGMDEPEMKIIDVFVCKLRRRLSLAGLHDIISTVWGRGYIIREVSAVVPLVGVARSPPRQLVA